MGRARRRDPAGTPSSDDVAAGLAEYHRVHVVDLSGALLDVARRRIADRGWSNVETAHADVTVWPAAETVDAVTLSYVLTMIPDWFRENMPIKT